MRITPDNIVSLADRRPAADTVASVGYTADQLLDTMFDFDVSASEARAMIEGGLTQNNVGAAVLTFVNKNLDQ